MNFRITTTGFDLTPELEQQIRGKMGHVERLTGMFPDASAHLMLARTTQHHKSADNLFKAEIEFAMAGRSVNASAVGPDITTALNALKDEVSRLVTSAAGKDRSVARHVGAKIKNFLRKGNQDSQQ
jgi:ribosome-associated translation inhibitor RaiA